MFIEIGRKICDPDEVVFYFQADLVIIIGILWILNCLNDLKLRMKKNIGFVMMDFYDPEGITCL
jgi:hypothetical protein